MAGQPSSGFGRTYADGSGGWLQGHELESWVKNNPASSAQAMPGQPNFGTDSHLPSIGQALPDRHPLPGYKHAELPLAALKPPGQHHRHGDLHQLAGLDHQAHIEPALRAFPLDTKQEHRQQQGHAQRLHRHRVRHQPLQMTTNSSPSRPRKMGAMRWRGLGLSKLTTISHYPAPQPHPSPHGRRVRWLR